MASEAWSVASSTIIDTRSEPPRYYGKEADKIMKRAAAPSPSATASVSSKAPSSSTPPMTLEMKFTKTASLNTQQQQQQPTAASQVSAITSGTNGSGGRSKKSKKSRSSSTSTKKSTSKPSSSSSKSKSSKKQQGRSSSSSAASSASNASISNSTINSDARSASYCSALRDQYEHAAKSKRSSDAGGSISHASGVDPPSSASTSGSSSSTAEDTSSPTLYDPPSYAGTGATLESGSCGTYSSVGSTLRTSKQSVGSRRSRRPRPRGAASKSEQLAVWNEEGDDDGAEEEEDGRIVSRDARSGNSGSRRSSVSGSQSTESSYCSDEMDSATRGSELSSAVERALAIRDQEGHYSEVTETASYDNGEDSTQENARALVSRDDYGGVNSLCDTQNSGQLVESDPTKNRFLSTAVDNYNAIVPIDSTIYEAYDHTFVTCPENLRFRFLYTFLKKNLDKKVMIFFSTTNSVKFHAKLLEHFHIPVSTMHGKQRREKFISRFFKYSDLDEGILCATDAAGRDLDIPPSVDWVIQFEPPDDPSEYILRVARISCDSDRVGRSLLFLNPGEQGFLKYYHSASIPVSEFEIPRGLADVQSHIEHQVNESERLMKYAQDAYGSYLIAYASHGFRDVYNVHDLNKTDVAVAFGLVGGLCPDDDLTADTSTMADSYVGGGELGETDVPRKKSSSGGGRNKTWEKQEKARSKTWMKGEKSWPHSQIKLHPKFKQTRGGAVVDQEEDEY